MVEMSDGGQWKGKNAHNSTTKVTYNASSLASPLAFLMPPILSRLVHTSAHCINQLKHIAHSNCCACGITYCLSLIMWACWS